MALLQGSAQYKAGQVCDSAPVCGAILRPRDVGGMLVALCCVHLSACLRRPPVLTQQEGDGSRPLACGEVPLHRNLRFSFLHPCSSCTAVVCRLSCCCCGVCVYVRRPCAGGWLLVRCCRCCCHGSRVLLLCPPCCSTGGGNTKKAMSGGTQCMCGANAALCRPGGQSCGREVWLAEYGMLRHRCLGMGRICFVCAALSTPRGWLRG